MHMPGQTKAALGNEVARNGEQRWSPHDVGATPTAIQRQDGVVYGTTVDESRVDIRKTGYSALVENAMHMLALFKTYRERLRARAP